MQQVGVPLDRERVAAGVHGPRAAAEAQLAVAAAHDQPAVPREHRELGRRLLELRSAMRAAGSRARSSRYAIATRLLAVTARSQCSGSEWRLERKSADPSSGAAASTACSTALWEWSATTITA